MKKLILFKLIFILFIPGSYLRAQKENGTPQREIKLVRKIKAEDFVSIEKSFTDIEITGWSEDRLEAKAVSNVDKKTLALRLTEEISAGRKVFTVGLLGNQRPHTPVRLFLKVPYLTTFKPIRIKAGTIRISEIAKPVRVRIDEGQIEIKNVASVFVQTISGGEASSRKVIRFPDSKPAKVGISLKNIRGRAEIITFRSVISARNIEGDVSLTSANSPQIDIRCVGGNILVNDTSSVINVKGVGGNLGGTNSTGVFRFTGSVRPGKQYSLKTLTGIVSVSVPDNSGFFAELKTYSGEIRNAFALKSGPFGQALSNEKEIRGSTGKGGARIELNSFSGLVTLAKASPNEIEKCGNQ